MKSVTSRKTFADNQRVTVADAIRASAEYRNHQYPLDIATGYFNIGGFISISDVLESAPAVRILIGAEPEPDTVPDTLEIDRDDPARAIERVETAILAGRDDVPFAASATTEIERLKHFLDKGTTQVRIYRKRFLHGKAFVFGNEESVLAGSANFTRAGLNFNLELDLGQYNPDDVMRVAEWYEQLWNDAEPYNLADIFNARLEEYEPHTIYLRMLYAQYSPDLVIDAASAAIVGSMQLTEFQKIGSQRAIRILDEWKGAMLADGVGLGKTVVAGDVIKTFAIERGLRVLIVAPASLRDMWKRFLFAQNLPGEVLSYAQLAQEPKLTGMQGASNLLLSPNQYRLIVADEAHALRNPDIGAYKAMLSFLAKSPDAKLLLLTATPVNNSLWDLYHEIMLFAKSNNAFQRVGVPDLRSHIKNATQQDPSDINPGHMFAVLDAVSVRRTRQFIKEHFPNAEINGVRIVFPKIVPHTERYDLDAVVPGLFNDAADAIEHRLHMARYRTGSYAIEPEPNATRQEFLSGLLRSQMLKRFESSAYAFRKTLERLIDTHVSCLTSIEQNGLVPLSALDAEVMQDDEQMNALLDDGEVAPAADFDVDRLCQDLREDIDTLNDLLAKISRLEPKDDPKLANLRDILKEAARNTDGNKRKTLVFTSFVDTVRYIKNYLEQTALTDAEIAAFVPNRSAYVLGNVETDVDSRAALAAGFAPRSMVPDDPEAPDKYDLLVTTDVLAEGQNLQQCGRIVNFDLPWNPMRVVQRNGRIDRIGSPHDVVDMHCFMPDVLLDQILGLEERLQRKIAHANAGIGIEGVIIPGIKTHEHVFAGIDDVITEKSEQIKRIAAGDEEVLKELDQDDAFSGEQFREELRTALLTEAGRDLEKLPWGIGSGHSQNNRPAVVFLAKAGGEHFFRTVFLDEGDTPISVDLLEALKLARCDYASKRVFPEAIRDAVYEAWSRARYGIHAYLQSLRDPANRRAPLSKSQRDAIDLLQRSTDADAWTTIEILATPWPTDVEKSLRAILKDESSADDAKCRQIITFVAERGLRPQPIKDVRDVKESDIKLVCYQVVVPK